MSKHNLLEVVKRPLIILHDGNFASVSVAKLSVGNVIENATGEIFNLTIEYEKGDEDGLNIYVTFPNSRQDDGDNPPREPGFSSVGGGVLLYYDAIRRFTSSTNTTGVIIPVNPNGKRFFRIFQQVQGVTAPTGVFKLYAEINSIAR